MKNIFCFISIFFVSLNTFAYSLKCDVKVRNSFRGVMFSQLMDVQLKERTESYNGHIFFRGTGFFAKENMSLRINGERVINPKDKKENYWRYDGVVYLPNGSISYFTFAHDHEVLSAYNGSLNGWSIGVRCQRHVGDIKL